MHLSLFTCFCFLVCYIFTRLNRKFFFTSICICFLVCYIFSRVKRKFLTCVCFLVCYIFSSRVKRNILHKRCDALLLFAHYCPLAAGGALLLLITNKILIILTRPKLAYGRQGLRASRFALLALSSGGESAYFS